MFIPTNNRTKTTIKKQEMKTNLKIATDQCLTPVTKKLVTRRADHDYTIIFDFFLDVVKKKR